MMRKRRAPWVWDPTWPEPIHPRFEHDPDLSLAQWHEAKGLSC